MTDKKHIAVLGSTGSIGVQALEVIQSHPEDFELEVLTAGNNSELLIKQALEFGPKEVVIVNESQYDKVKEALQGKDILVKSGEDALEEVVAHEDLDLVLTALVGYAGLKPTINAIKHGKNIALANKETLVVAGQLVTELARKNQVAIYPVDSEHSAIFQCLMGEEKNPIEKIILTCSGGPFRGRSRDFLKDVTKAQALKHPNWDMGAKITIDSASLMNKGLEVIEAHWLFDVGLDQIEVVVHPQSIIHSLVQFEDGSMKAQLGLPDMRIPIQFALSYPNRLKADFPRFNFADYPSLSFEEPDLQNFRNLKLAYDALDSGGNKPCVLNAANEVAVDQFLKDQIGFLQMSEIVEICMDRIPHISEPTYEEYIFSDKETRIKALELVK